MGRFQAVAAAAAEAQVNDLKQEEEMKQLQIEMQADEKMCGDRVTKVVTSDFSIVVCYP